MIIIFAIFLTTVCANSQESNKFIDRLTDEEKQEFLDNVARRIMESVESNGTGKGIIEPTDAQLSEHSSYVRSVMEQEIAAFKARRNERKDRPSKEDKSKENDNPKESLKVKPFQSHDDDVDKLDAPKADNIDLTVTDMNQRSSDETPQNNFTDTSGMDNVTKDTLPLQMRSTTSNVKREEITEASTMKNSDNEATLATTFENNSQNKTLNVTSSLQEIDNVLTETTISSKIQILEYDSATNSNTIYLITERNEYLDNNFEPSSNATESKTLDNSDGALTSSLTDKSTIDSVTNTGTDESSDVSTTVNSQVFITTTQNTAEVNTATTENYSAIKKDSSEKERFQAITETTKFTPILTTSNIKEEQSTKKWKKFKLIKTIKQPENDILVSYVASKALKNIKHELELKKKGKFIDNDIETNNGNTHLNHYQVYEIPWPIKRDNQPFLRSQDTIKYQPHFIPIYKYSPNFAYYNPKNRLGPNKVEENLREGNKDVLDKIEPSEFVLQSNNKIRKFIHLFKWLSTTTTTSTARPAWPSFPFKGRNRTTTTRAPFNPFKHLRTTTTTPAPIHNMSESSKEHWNMLAIPHENDVFIDLPKLQTVKLRLMRSKAESKVNIYMDVLKGLVREDSKSLKQYDWLTTTVQIQSALTKILKLIKRQRQSEQLYPADLQILRYMVFLHNFSLEVKKENNKKGDKLRKGVKFLPKNILSKEKSLINRDWKYLRTPHPGLLEDDRLSHLYEFLIDVQDGLFDLHEAIRHIAEVTKFDRQNWYGNLKQLYLTADEKHLRELLLHILMSRLVDLVENSCKHSLDDNFIQFVKTNKKDAKRIVEEMIFINDIVHEITINKG